MELDTIDKELLSRIQQEFPVTLRPFQTLGDQLGISEQEAITRIGQLKKDGLIRQISAIFDTQALGYKSCLVAMKVPSAKVEKATDIINKHPGVSHNYERDHNFNIWFTLAVGPTSRLGIEQTVEIIKGDVGATGTLILPATKVFKIGVKFDLTENGTEVLEKEQDREVHEKKIFHLSETEMELIKELQEDLPAISTPYGDILNRLGISIDQLLEAINHFKERAILRRVAAVVRHKELGFKANAMGVWVVPEEKIDEVGKKMAQFKAVSHCYQRQVYPDWPYSMFTMVHAKDRQSCEEILGQIANATGINQFDSLYSLREFKKTRIKYFSPEFEKWEKGHV